MLEERTEDKVLVDVYHSGDDRPSAPFLLMPLKAKGLPAHPERPKGGWCYWKSIPVHAIAVLPKNALTNIARNGFYIQ